MSGTKLERGAVICCFVPSPPRMPLPLLPLCRRRSLARLPRLRGRSCPPELSRRRPKLLPFLYASRFQSPSHRRRRSPPCVFCPSSDLVTNHHKPLSPRRTVWRRSCFPFWIGGDGHMGVGRPERSISAAASQHFAVPIDFFGRGCIDILRRVR